MELKKKMLSSIYKNGGFFIGRYEAGREIPKKNYDNTTDDIVPLSKKGLYPYNFVYSSQAQYLASKYRIENYETSLMFGIQWDLTLKFIELHGKFQDGTKITKNMLLEDGSSFGNYKDETFVVENGKYILGAEMSEGIWVNIEESYIKPKDITVLFSTGITTRNCISNIYDLSGNLYEWTLENSLNELYHSVSRGCGYVASGSNGGSPSYRWEEYNSEWNYRYVGFRITIF